MKQLEAELAKAARELYKVDIDSQELQAGGVRGASGAAGSAGGQAGAMQFLWRPEEQFGDYTTNLALQLAKQLKQRPAAIAEALRARLADLDYVESATVAGPGFINIRLADKLLLTAAINSTKLPKPLAGQIVVAEYSDPNPFKTLHAGHLYTTLVGDAVASLLEAAGAKVYRVNFGGDVGLHVARAMWAILKHLGGPKPKQLETIDPATKLDWISQRYVEGTSAYETDPKAKKAIDELNQKIYQIHTDQDKSSDLAQIYWTCRQWSYDGFDSLYKRLKVDPFDKYYPESQTTELGIKTVKAGLAKGIFVKSDGATVYKGEADGLHTRVFLTSAGLPTYETKDLGLALHKWNDYRFDKSVMITGNEIDDYMKVVMAALKHFDPKIAERTVHLTHGQIKLAGGTKMSSRKGSILRASDVLDAASAANQKARGKADEATELGAVKYSFLKQRIGGDIIYDPEESVSLEGNSGPYLQYAHARARSILQKATSHKPQATRLEAQGSGLKVLETGERSLARKISQYPEVVAEATAELLPSHISTYLYELAQTFNRFYEANRVLGDQRQALRLKLVEAYADVLSSGLELLNIAAPQRL